MNGRKIVFINQATGYLTIDILNQFASEFDKVVLIAGSIRIQDIPLAGTVQWVRIRKYSRGNTLKKLLSWVWASMQILFLLITHFRKYEIFYFTVPPTAYLLSRILPNKFSVLVADVFPDSLKIYNIQEKTILYKIWQRWNIKIFEKAHRVYTLGESMRKALSNYIDAERIIVINNWSGLVNLNHIPKENNPFIQKNKLDGKFVVMYSGNIGYTHNVETLISVAEELISIPDICFLIVGRGERYNAINQMIKSKKLSNCLLMPFQDDREIRYSLSAADLSVVILDETVALSSIPSKTYNLLAVGSAFMVIGSEFSELSGFVRKHDIGNSFLSSAISDMTSFILKLKNERNLLFRYKQNSQDLSKIYTNQNSKKYLTTYLDINDVTFK